MGGTDQHLAAVLFDMDGLLVDSEPQWFAAETKTVAALGGVWGKKQQVDLLGSNLRFAAEYMVEHTGCDTPVEQVMSLLLDQMTIEMRGGVTFRPGALDLVDRLSRAAVPMALVTSSVRVHVDAVLAHLPAGVFAHVVTADDVARLKPHPEPYLTALARLGVPAAGALALEDSPAGVAAAEAAGCRVLAVPSVTSIPEVDGRRVRPSLVGLTPHALQAMLTPS